MDDAVKAYEAALRYQAPDADRLAELRRSAGAGQGRASSRRRLREPSSRRVKLDAGSPKARFYLARAAEQDGQVEKAKAAYTELLSRIVRPMPPGSMR